jgi:hypothetical protein
MDLEKAQKATSKIILYSLVKWVNELETFDDDEKENVSNMVFNVLTNSFNPDMALYFNNTIIDIASTQNTNKEEMMRIVLDQLNRKD